MENMNQNSNRPINPRRRRRTQMQIFKEAYLPVIIAGAAVILIIIFIIGSISRAAQRNEAELAASIATSESLAAEKARLDQEAAALAKDAQELALQYDYEGAISLLNTFEGNIDEYPTLQNLLTSYQATQSSMVAWDNISEIPNLSFQLLIADPERAFANATYGSSYKRNFVTTEEFSAILQQLYDNGYVLVTPKDFVTTKQSFGGEVYYTTNPIYLPAGKKPLMLTQTQVNYNTYMIDGDGDKLPDKDGAGFASRLLKNGSGFTCEMVTATGETVTGAYDLVPILEDFLKQNPDFSYKGSKAVLAVTGYDGLFGYRTSQRGKVNFGDAAHATAVQEAKTLIRALKDSGYELACYTYENEDYGNMSTADIQKDLNRWREEVTPILGDVNILAFAQNSDIGNKGPYSGTKFTVLQDAGFRIYLGFCDDGEVWGSVESSYVRMGRLLVTGSNLTSHADWFTDLFNAEAVLDPAR